MKCKVAEEEFWQKVANMDERRIAGEDIGLLKRSDIPFWIYIKSRILTPMQILAGFKSPVFPPTSIGAILFNARYNAGPKKCIVGYDFY